jgi:outer membrane biosynthesis protein TonB
MPLLETPPNPAPPPQKPNEPVTFTTRRFGELQEHELIHLLDSIDDEISKARFRESIYISIILCLGLAWLAFYGPRVLFHQGTVINAPEEVTKLDDKELKYLDLPSNLIHKPPPKTKTLSDQDRRAQTPKPVETPKPPQPRPNAPGVQAAPAPQPQQQQPRQQAAQPTPQPPAPQPQQRPQQNQNASIPDAPHPTIFPQAKPNFGGAQSPGESNRNAATSSLRGGGGNYGAGPANHNGASGQVEILSDTLGVDFGPYIKRLLRILYNSWVPLIPEETRPPLNKEGNTLIRFTINADGTLKVGGMHLDASTHDEAIDRAAWGSIVGVGQFPPLPKEFKGPELTLRINFIIAHNAPPNDF